LIGELIIELKGRVNAVRVLPGGRTETSEQGSGNVLGAEATWLATTISTPMHNGIVQGEGNGILTTVDGEVVMIRKSGIGWSTGKGWKASRRGVFFHATQSQKLARLNRVVGMYEFESSEEGDWMAKIWEWK
jgi:hypothetical protein